MDSVKVIERLYFAYDVNEYPTCRLSKNGEFIYLFGELNVCPTREFPITVTETFRFH